jgi:glycosyltransferase involved in cell wall biosynthesis
MNPVLSLARNVLHLPRRAALYGRRRGIFKAPGAEPVVGFGGVLDGKSLIHGGAVKLLSLREAFGADEREFNVLYLVSSAMPEFAVDLVRSCRAKGIRFVWNQNGVGYPAWAGADTERHNAPMRRLRAQADFVVYQSAFCRECAADFLGPCPVPDEVLFNPVNLGKFSPPPQPLPARPLRLLTLGTHGYPARVLSTIQCLEALRSSGTDATLTIAGKFEWPGGDGEVRAEATRLGVESSVKILPAFTQDQAAELYRAHHVLLHPKYLDPCPTVVIEALASGLPVIGSRSGGLPEMVPDSCGVLIPLPLAWDRMITPSGGELASAVTAVAARLGEYSGAARSFSERTFDGGRWVARHGEIFRNLL